MGILAPGLAGASLRASIALRCAIAKLCAASDTFTSASAYVVTAFTNVLSSACVAGGAVAFSAVVMYAEFASADSSRAKASMRAIAGGLTRLNLRPRGPRREIYPNTSVFAAVVIASTAGCFSRRSAVMA